MPIDHETLLASMCVADVIPNPARTRLIDAAEARGCDTITGIEMLVNQGARGLKYWAGIDADKHVMRGALRDAFAVHAGV